MSLLREARNTGNLKDQEEHWISTSDLMALLMMVFLLIAIVYQAIVEVEKEKIQEVAIVYNELKKQLYEDLLTEFRDDLPKWKAGITPELVVQFKEPDILFESGSSELRPRFKEILKDFFPRYIRVLTSGKYIDDIEEIRIEGHTSSVCRGCANLEESYFYNMGLSQARTRSALAYVLQLQDVASQVEWLRRRVTANGLSFSRLVLKEDGTEDLDASRRVEFRVVTDAEQKIAKILEITSE